VDASIKNSGCPCWRSRCFYAKSEFRSELHPQAAKVGRAVQTELYAVVLEAVVRFVRVLRGGLDVEDVVAAKGQLGIFADAVGKAQVGRGLGRVAGVRYAFSRAAEGTQGLRTKVDDAQVRFQLARDVVEAQGGFRARAPCSMNRRSRSDSKTSSKPVSEAAS